MESMTSLGNLTTVSPVNCSPWEDYVEIHNGDSCIGLVMFVHCIATILSNAVLFAVIFSKKDSRDQVIIRNLSKKSHHIVFWLSVGEKRCVHTIICVHTIVVGA